MLGDLTVSFHVAQQKPGHVKVRLSFNTWDPKHARSAFLKNEADAKPPFLEDVHVLVPVSAAFNRLSAYRDIFRRLIAAGILAPQDTLRRFEFREEDTTTLAYVEKICY